MLIMGVTAFWNTIQQKKVGMADVITNLVIHAMESDGLIPEEEKSMLKLLEQVEARFSKEYKSIKLNGQNCFVGENGTIFYFVALEQFRSLLVEYADNIDSAKSGLFDDGDLVDADQDFETMIRELQEEIRIEVA